MEPQHPTPKYPRSPHLPWSPNLTDDEKVIQSLDNFIDAPVIVTEKLDGSNCTLSRGSLFARSHNGPPRHISFNWLKGFYASLKDRIPQDRSVFVEYTYAVHSIRYEKLPHCVFVFGVRHER